MYSQLHNVSLCNYYIIQAPKYAALGKIILARNTICYTIRGCLELASKVLGGVGRCREVLGGVGRCRGANERLSGPCGDLSLHHPGLQCGPLYFVHSLGFCCKTLYVLSDPPVCEYPQICKFLFTTHRLISPLR